MADSKKQEKHILLVTGNLTERNNLSSRLRMQGYKVEAATGGFHSIHLLEKFNYDLVLIVEDMDDMPGLEVVCHTRTLKNKEQLPILYMSKSSAQEEILGTIELGANDYLVNNNNFANILKKIKKLVN